MRAVLTLFIVLLYCTLFSYYLIEMNDITIPMKGIKLLYNFITLGMVMYFFIDFKLGFTSYLHQQFNTVCICCVMINFIFIILTHAEILTNPIKMLWCFNGSVFATTAIVLISGLKHGTFTKD